MDLKGKTIAILATNGLEQSELEVPRERLKQAGATVHVISLAAGQRKAVTSSTALRDARSSLSTKSPALSRGFV